MGNVIGIGKILAAREEQERREAQARERAAQEDREPTVAGGRGGSRLRCLAHAPAPWEGCAAGARRVRSVMWISPQRRVLSAV